MRVVLRRQPIICEAVQDAIHDTTQLLNKVKGLEDTVRSVAGANEAVDAEWATTAIRHALHELLEVQRDSCGGV